MSNDEQFSEKFGGCPSESYIEVEHVKWFWCVFFMIWPVAAVVLCLIAPSQGWWFQTMVSPNPLGRKIDHLFYVILWISTVVFVGTQFGLGYVLFQSAKNTEKGVARKAWYSHGRHDLEVIWSVVPAVVLLFIALYQMNVWAEFRVTERFPQQRMLALLERLGQVRTEKDTFALAEVTGRQFEWRIRYPGFDEQGRLLPLKSEPQPTDLYDVNDLRLPAGSPGLINLRSEDVQHSFYLPDLRIKQDAVPGWSIPVWLESDYPGTFILLCAELCGWGHYKMKAHFTAETEEDFMEYLRDLHRRQNYDGRVVEE